MKARKIRETTLTPKGLPLHAISDSCQNFQIDLLGLKLLKKQKTLTSMKLTMSSPAWGLQFSGNTSLKITLLTINDIGKQ